MPVARFLIRRRIMRAVLVGIAVLGLAATVQAAPCYGTKLPLKKQLFVGVQTHYLFKRYQEHEAGKFRSGQQFLLISYGVCDWLSVDLKGGGGFIKQHPHNSVELDYPAYMGGGYGFRLKVYDNKTIRAVCGFQHISVHPYTIHTGAGEEKHKAVLDDWQLSGLLSYEVFKVTPYLGAKWSRVDYIHWVDGTRDRVKSDLTKSIGVVFGIEVPLSKTMWLNLEGQALDGEAASCSVNYSF